MTAPRQGGLPEALYWILIGAFGATTCLLIRALDQPAMGRLDLLLMGAGAGAVLTGLVWFFFLGVRRSAVWGIALLIPYLNLLVAAAYARRYWREEAWAPALLAIAGLLSQSLATIRMWTPSLPPMV